MCPGKGFDAFLISNKRLNITDSGIAHGAALIIIQDYVQGLGDSCSNIITPLNPYVVIILVFMQKYMPKGGIGTLVALMLPYAVVFAVVWTALLLIWMATGAELGPQGPLWYTPSGQ